QKELLLSHSPGRAHREIAELGRLVGGVPALYDAVEALRPVLLTVALKPICLDQTATERRRGLLVLAGEVVLADSPADAIQYFGRLAVRMQGFALPPREGLRSPDGLDLVHLVRLAAR